MRRSWLEYAMPWLVTIGFVVLWQAAVDGFGIEPFVLPSPLAVMRAYIEFQPTILKEAWYTLMNTLGGFVIGVTGGLALGHPDRVQPACLSRSLPAADCLQLGPEGGDHAHSGAVDGHRAAARHRDRLPAVLLSGGGERCDRGWRRRSRSWKTCCAAWAPAGSTYAQGRAAADHAVFFASLKVAITLAFVGAVIAETIASNGGIGFLMLQASSQFRVPLMFAGVSVIALMGVATYAVFALIERRVTGWSTRRNDVQVQSGGG